MLVVTAEVRDAIVGHAIASLPNEACGLLAEVNDVVDHFVAVENAAQSPTRFVLDPQQMLDAESEIDASGRSLVGVVHSHVDTAPYPSPTDIADAARYDPDATLVQVIVSLRHPEPAIRAYSLGDGEVTELRVDIAADEPTAHDGTDNSGPIAAVARLPVPPPS